MPSESVNLVQLPFRSGFRPQIMTPRRPSHELSLPRYPEGRPRTMNNPEWVGNPAHLAAPTTSNPLTFYNTLELNSLMKFSAILRTQLISYIPVQWTTTPVFRISKISNMDVRYLPASDPNRLLIGCRSRRRLLGSPKTRMSSRDCLRSEVGRFRASPESQFGSSTAHGPRWDSKRAC